MKVEPGEWADDAGAKGWAERLHRQNPQYRTIELWDRKRLVERCQRVPDTSQTAPKSDPLDADACRAQAGKLRADAAREQAPEQREVLLAMAKEYDTLADEMEARQMMTFPPAATYRKLALELRATARAKTDRYAQRLLLRAAEDYDRLATQIEQAGALDRAAPSLDPGPT